MWSIKDGDIKFLVAKKGIQREVIRYVSSQYKEEGNTNIDDQMDNMMCPNLLDMPKESRRECWNKELLRGARESIISNIL